MNKVDDIEETNINPNTLNGQALAYLGDAVYEVAIRRHLLNKGLAKPQNLQREATHFVSAKAQAGLITKMKDDHILSAEELAAFKHGRNAKSHTKAKNTSLHTYQLSTGFEAMIGYLDLANQQDRTLQLIKWCIAAVENGDLKKYDFN